jgi:hypothetical protein
MAVRRALRTASLRLLLLEPVSATMRLKAPFVPPPAAQMATRPLTEKVCGKAGAQERSCWPSTVIDVMVFELPAVVIWILPLALAVPTDEVATEMVWPFGPVPVAMAVMMTFEPDVFAPYVAAAGPVLMAVAISLATAVGVAPAAAVIEPEITGTPAIVMPVIVPPPASTLVT